MVMFNLHFVPIKRLLGSNLFNIPVMPGILVIQATPVNLVILVTFLEKPIILLRLPFREVTLGFFALSPPPLWMFVLVSVCVFLH